MSSSIDATPLTWIVRFKYHKTTILLHLDPLTPLSTVKSNLLAALRDTKPNGIQDRPLPSTYAQLRLAKPVDPSDADKGWESIEPSLADDFDDEEISTAKAKAQAKKKLESTSAKAAGIKENGVVAFRWLDDGEEEDEGLDAKNAVWDVVLPTFEDAYHEVNEGDVGGAGLARDFRD
jgi:hypothetical protein